MRGILEGMSLTLSHMFRPKVTRLYPYEKPKLPPRSRGLIQLIAEGGLNREFNLKCESCLLCEKACPPRAITIEYEPAHNFVERPWYQSYIRDGAEKFTPRKIPAASGTPKGGYTVIMTANPITSATPNPIQLGCTATTPTAANCTGQVSITVQ